MIMLKGIYQDRLFRLVDQYVNFKNQWQKGNDFDVIQLCQ